jgi:hypothetical protein
MRQNYLKMKFIYIFIIMDKKLYNSVSKLVKIGDALNIYFTYKKYVKKTLTRKIILKMYKK